MYKKLLKYLLIAPLLMAFQCDEETESPLRFNNYSVKVTPKATFTLDETIWIDGVVSAKAYDLSLKDSIINEFDQGDVFSIFKLIEPTQISNAKDAIDQFDLIFDVGNYSFFARCENAQTTANSELNNEGSFYNYRIGLKPKAAGDYIISWQDAVIQNENRNEFIIENYLLTNDPNAIGFDQCGSVSSRLMNQSKKEYFFSVE